MKAALTSAIGVSGLAIAFVAGYASRGGGSGALSQPAAVRRVLYWHDPMHPAYHADKPGIAPDCGMQLEPVYDDGISPRTMPPGSVKVAADKLRMLGVRVEPAGQRVGTSKRRLLGRVAVDERLVYRLNAATDGWIREVAPVTTGSLVVRNQRLASFYAPEVLPAMQAYLFAVSSLDRFVATGKETEAQIALSKGNLQQAADTLRTLGMAEGQLAEIARTRSVPRDVYVEAPGAGVVLARNVTLGQRFERGFELFRIADLKSVWVIADVYERDRDAVQPGSQMTVHYGERRMTARVSAVPPVFDAATRTLKLRLELPNPGQVLRPDMFVDVEWAARSTGLLHIPLDAVLHSGTRDVVFVERETGVYEPREVRTRFVRGGEAEVLDGLAPGERIVVAGTFLIDSESRLQLAAQGISAAAVDPVCGMTTDASKAGDKKSVYQGRTCYFCSQSCKKDFDKGPQSYTAKKPPGGSRS